MEIKREQLEKSIKLFLKWLNSYGDYSYDKDDILDSKAGVFMKNYFYKHKITGAPMAALLLLQETLLPSLVRLTGKKRREAIAEANYAQGLLNLFKYYGKSCYLENSVKRLNYLKCNSIKGYSGYCWGYSKGWQTPYGYWPAGTPCITTTPYVYWAFKKYYTFTDDASVKNMLKSIANFALYDLKEIRMPNGTYSSQYSTLDNYGAVVNAVSYRCALLYDAWKIFDNAGYKEAADKNLNFILSAQKEDGSWPYHAIDQDKAMIDNFHTCFILKNLFIAYTVTGNKRIMESLKSGLGYYKEKLLYPDSRPRHFSKPVFIKFRKYEMYDYAEIINLGVKAKECFPDFFQLAKESAEDLVTNFQLKDGHFVTRITSFGTKHKMPYHRWPQAQIFNSLTLLLNNL